MENNLGSWSWQDIQTVYAGYGKQLNEFARIKKAVGLQEVKLDIRNSDLQNIFVLRFTRDIQKIDMNLALLDREIARRNNLIGVMG